MSWKCNEFEILEKSNIIQCDVCTSVMAKPLVFECGHTFCENCVKTIQSGPLEGRKCPTCRGNVAKASINVALANLYDSLKAKCLNEGCTWSGTVAQHATHSHSCESKIIACRHETCQKTFKRSLLEGHMAACPCRPATCTGCNEEIPQNVMEKHTSEDCWEREVTCPFFSDESSKHLMKLNQCTIHMVGCAMKPRRCDVPHCTFWGVAHELQAHKAASPAKHIDLLRTGQNDMGFLVSTKPMEAKLKVRKELKEVWSTQWTIQTEQVATARIPLVSPQIDKGDRRWRFVLYPSSGEIYVQLVATPSEQTIYGRVILQVELADRSPMKSDLNEYAFVKGSMGGWKFPALKTYLRARNSTDEMHIKVAVAIVRYSF